MTEHYDRIGRGRADLRRVAQLHGTGHRRRLVPARTCPRRPAAACRCCWTPRLLKTEELRRPEAGRQQGEDAEEGPQLGDQRLGRRGHQLLGHARQGPEERRPAAVRAKAAPGDTPSGAGTRAGNRTTDVDPTCDPDSRQSRSPGAAFRIFAWLDRYNSEHRILPVYHCTVQVACATGAPMAIDPICRMTVDPSTAKAERDGETYYFCCEHCRQKFLCGAARKPQAPRSKTCPARSTPARCTPRSSSGPGACPKCGMALEPKSVALADGGRRPRTARHDAAVLGRAGLRPCRCCCWPCCRWSACRWTAGSGLASAGCNCCWPRRSCSGPAGRSSSAAGGRSSRATSTCSRSSRLGTGRPISTASSPCCSRALFPSRSAEHGHVRRLFRGGGRSSPSGAAGPGAGTAGPAAHRRRDPRTAGPGAAHRPAASRDGEVQRRAAGGSPPGDLAAGPARRQECPWTAGRRGHAAPSTNR